MAEPIPFREMNMNWKGDGLPGGVSDLPAYVDDTQTICCWKLTKPEIEEIARTGMVFVRSLNYRAPLQPICVEVFRPFVQR